MSNKTSDKNVGSIEDDVKILKNIIEVYENCSVPEIDMQIDITFRKKEANAIKTVLGNLEILSDMQRSADRELENARKINKEHQKVNGELRKKVKELEEERQLVGIPVRNKRNGTIGIVLHQWKSGSIAVLENINPRVINTHDSWSTLEIITDEIKQTKTKDDSISKQKIKDKIEELTNTKGDFATYIATSERIKVLQELLQESEDK